MAPSCRKIGGKKNKNTIKYTWGIHSLTRKRMKTHRKKKKRSSKKRNSQRRRRKRGRKRKGGVAVKAPVRGGEGSDDEAEPVATVDKVTQAHKQPLELIPLELIEPESIARELEKIEGVKNVDYEVAKWNVGLGADAKIEIYNKISFHYNYNNLNYIVSFGKGFGIEAAALSRLSISITGERDNRLRKSLREEIINNIQLKINKELITRINAFIYYYEETDEEM